MDKRVTIWANNFYGRSLGLSEPYIDLEDASKEKMLIDNYNKFFVVPLAQMLTGTDTLPEDNSIANLALTEIASHPITDWVYLLKYWVDNKFFVYTGDFSHDMAECVKRTQKEMHVLFATAGVNGKDIALHTHNGKIIDVTPTKLFIYPKGMKAHYNGRLLHDFASKHPCEVSEAGRSMLAEAIKGNYITEADLRTEAVFVPTNSGESEELRQLHALSKDLPPYDFCNLVASLPDYILSSCATQFLAVCYHMDNLGGEVSPTVNAYVNSVRGSHIDVPAGYELVDLNDEEVIRYLRTNHGIEVNDLQELQTAPTGFAMTDISLEDLQGSAEDILSSLNTASKGEFTTLDVLISNYCKTYGINQNCTIEQLINSINYDIHPEPMNVKSLLVSEIADSDISDETTLREFIDGSKHRPVDPVDVMLDYICDNPLFPESTAALIRDTLIYDKVCALPKNDEYDIVGFVDSLKYPKEVKDVIMHIISTGEIPQGVTISSDSEIVKINSYMLTEVRKYLDEDASFDVRSDLTDVLYVFLRFLMASLPADKENLIDFVTKRIHVENKRSEKILTEVLSMLK